MHFKPYSIKWRLPGLSVEYYTVAPFNPNYWPRRQQQQSAKFTCCFSTTSVNCDKITNLDSNSHNNQQQDYFSNSSNTSMFLRRLLNSLRELESSIGFSQQSLQHKLQSSMPLLNEALKFQHGNENLVQSLQLKLSLTSLNTASFSQSPSYSNKPFFEKIRQKLIREQQTLFNQFEILSQTDDPSSLVPQTFQSVWPRESFLILLIAHLMSPRLVNNRVKTDQLEPVRKHLFMLLNIIQLIRDGAHTRIFGEEEQHLPTEEEVVDGSSQIDHYRWSILKGNFYFYNMTYNLMRLNMKNVTELMTNSLQDLITIQYWLEREAITRLTRQCSIDQGGRQYYMTTMAPSVRLQFATGQLMSVWQHVVVHRDISLLSNGCHAIAYLLGKDNQSEYRVAQQLGTSLATIISLLDDYCFLKVKCHHFPKSLNSSPEKWSLERHLNFLLRLPVLMYLKEANSNAELHLPLSETNCNTIVCNVSALV